MNNRKYKAILVTSLINEDNSLCCFNKFIESEFDDYRKYITKQKNWEKYNKGFSELFSYNFENSFYNFKIFIELCEESYKKDGYEHVTKSIIRQILSILNNKLALNWEDSIKLPFVEPKIRPNKKLMLKDFLTHLNEDKKDLIMINTSEEFLNIEIEKWL